MSVPEELEDLVARVVAGMPTPNMATRVLRWEYAYDLGSGLTAARRQELHAAVTALVREGGILFVVVPLGEVSDGASFGTVRAAVSALAGKANLGDVEAEVMVGRVLAFEFAVAPEIEPLSAELDDTSCSASDLDTAAFRRASRSGDGAPEGDGLTVMTALDRQLIAMRAATRDGLRVVGTVAGVLAFHRAPYQHISGAHVVVDAATGAGYHGPLSEVAANTARWASAQGFPHHAVAELVRNAWVHRDWSSEARRTPILVQRSGRRLDVVTPGALTRVGHVRNPVLQGLCRRAGLVNGHGIGIEDLRDDLLDDGKCSLELSSMNGEVRARLTLARVAAPTEGRAERTAATASGGGSEVGSSSSSAAARSSHQAGPQPRTVRPPDLAGSPPATTASQAVPSHPAPPLRDAPAPTSAPQVHVGANARDEQLVRFVAGHGEVSCKLVQDELGWSRSTARDVLARLVAVGRLRRTAEDPRSPTQAYRLA